MSLDQRITPYPVSLYDPPLTDETPEYGDEDAPERDAGLSFAEHLLDVAAGFRAKNTDAGDYIAGLLTVKSQVCTSQQILTPRSLLDFESREFVALYSDRIYLAVRVV